MEPSSDDRPYAVLDIDGVLADVRHRLHHLEGRPRDWDRFFAGAPDDPLLAAGAALALELAGDHEVLYLTGRPERYRADTDQWLERHGLPDGRLVMRRDDDRRPARFMKVDMLHRLERDRTVGVLVDDDIRVVEAARAAGFTVRHATWMVDTASEQQALFDAQETEGRT